MGRIMNIKAYRHEIEEIVEACHRLAELGYVTSSGGNISLRVDNNILLITPTKTPKRLMKAEDICAVDLNGDTLYSPDGKKPTGETPLHALIMRRRPEVKAVIHAHPPVLTGFAIAGSDLLAKPILPEPVLEVGPALLVKYATPISEELSRQFEDVVEESNCFLMENHGVTLCNVNSVFEAAEQIQMMESMAISVITALRLESFKPLTKEQTKELDNVIKQRGLTIPGRKGKYDSVTSLYKHDQH